MIRKIVLCGIAILLLGCPACSEKAPDSSQEKNDSEWWDFTAYTTNLMTVTPEGYYTIAGGFLYYVSPDLQESTIVCSKPDCIHNDTQVDNLYEYNDCDAYFGGANSVDYYDGWLYVVGYTGMGNELYRVSLDGTERELLYQAQVDCLFDIYDGYAYLGEGAYTSEGKIHSVTRFPLEDPDKTEVLYKTEEYPEASMNRMRFYDGNCYFYLFDSSEIEEGNAVYLKIDLDSGETEPLYERSNCCLEWNDYGILTEIRDYTPSDAGLTWESKYYRIAPGSEEKEELTEKDFGAIGTNDMLCNMDDKYIYFRTIGADGKEVLPEENKVKVYDYEGNLKAEVPIGEIEKATAYVLAGTEQYAFIQNICIEDGSWELWYVDKSEFDGGTVEPKKMELERRG